MSDLFIVAFGGNALNSPGGDGSVSEMSANIQKALSSLLPILQAGNRLVITHGNGPQVGMEMLKNDAGKSLYDTSVFPLDVLVAATQGQIGYLIECQLRNILSDNGLRHEVSGMISMIEVDSDDPAFTRPEKRVGKTYYDASEVAKLQQEKKWQFAEEIKNGKKGWRRVVPSPEPKHIVNKKSLRTLVDAGIIVVAGGGGGIPVVRSNGFLQGVEAVIDKDRATALLAEELSADRMIILTDVPYVYLDYGTPNAERLFRISLAEADMLIKEGVFGKGNMLPKIQAAYRFVKRTGHPAVITDFDGLQAGSGTEIVP